MRAHGAWIYLFASIGAGALVGADRGVEFAVERAMLAGTGFVGAFLLFAAIASGVRRKGRQALTGGCLMIFAPLAVLGLGAQPVFLCVAAGAVLPAVSVIVLARQIGPLARLTLVVGIGAITMSAPVTALAGQASGMQCVLLFGLLYSFFCWRTLRVAATLKVEAAWDRQSLKSRGLGKPRSLLCGH